jgi:hypothetical protein
MAYATNAGVRGSKATRAYNAADIAIIRTRTRKPHVPVHLIGGLANAMGTAETTGFMQAVADCGPVGYSVYDFPITRPAAWKALATPPTRDHQPCA